MSIQYTLLGFKPTSLGTRVSFHNHQGSMLSYKNVCKKFRHSHENHATFPYDVYRHRTPTDELGKDHCTAGLQFDKSGLAKKENMLLFVCIEAVQSKLVKLETICTVMLPFIGDSFLLWELILYCLSFQLSDEQIFFTFLNNLQREIETT